MGPRPERLHFVEEFGDTYRHYGDRHRVPCGLTGWAQIHGLRGDTSIAARARYDNYYIENWSVWLDIKIIPRTATSMFKASADRMVSVRAGDPAHLSSTIDERSAP